MTFNPTVTRIEKDTSCSGWSAIRYAFGGDDYDWKIVTRKMAWGTIRCSAIAGEMNKYYMGFAVYEQPIILHEGGNRATKKAVEEAHLLGTLAFEKMRDSGELPTKYSNTCLKPNGLGEIKFLKLESVGTAITQEGMTYSIFQDGTLDLDNEAHLEDCCEEWFETLSISDLQQVNAIKLRLILSS